jgi:hypothetical protein
VNFLVHFWYVPSFNTGLRGSVMELSLSDGQCLAMKRCEIQLIQRNSVNPGGCGMWHAQVSHEMRRVLKLPVTAGNNNPDLTLLGIDMHCWKNPYAGAST